MGRKPKVTAVYYRVEKPFGYVKPVITLDIPWINELRNPDVKQTRGSLKNESNDELNPNQLGECCLGVASRLQGRLKVQKYCEIMMWRDFRADGAYEAHNFLSSDNPIAIQFNAAISESDMRKKCYRAAHVGDKGEPIDRDDLCAIGAKGEFPEGVKVVFTTDKTGRKNDHSKGHCFDLASCNDNGMPFIQIAEVILEVWDIRYSNPEHQHEE
jgi:hypothetical protein